MVWQLIFIYESTDSSHSTQFIATAKHDTIKGVPKIFYSVYTTFYIARLLFQNFGFSVKSKNFDAIARREINIHTYNNTQTYLFSNLSAYNVPTLYE